MGNDQSDLKKFVIDSKSIETTTYWTLHYAEVPKSDPPILVSVFRSEGPPFNNQSPLIRAIRVCYFYYSLLNLNFIRFVPQNLKIYRHPSLLKYISSWEDSSQHFLATEQCRPLTFDIKKQGNLQICLGLRNVLCGLIFLVEQVRYPVFASQHIFLLNRLELFV